MVKSNNPKIFGIGLNKTGTTTLGACGRILGFTTVGCRRDLFEDIVKRNDFTRVRAVVDQYDLFEDWPWPIIYRQLDEMYPGSKFILTTRSSAGVWLNSLKNHAMRTPLFKHCRKLAYGYNYPHYREQEHLAYYQRHNDEVRAYFAGRENDFMEICWEDGEGWERLCAFLGKPVPDVPIPHANKGSEEQVGRITRVLNAVLSKV